MKGTPVTGRVTVEVGEVVMDLLPPVEGQRSGDLLPWAWACVCSLRFRFPGGAVTTKQVRMVHRMSDGDDLSLEARADGFLAALARMRHLIARHGVSPEPLVFRCRQGDAEFTAAYGAPS